jgi:hypothetical protein
LLWGPSQVKSKQWKILKISAFQAIITLVISEHTLYSILFIQGDNTSPG